VSIIYNIPSQIYLSLSAYLTNNDSNTNSHINFTNKVNNNDNVESAVERIKCNAITRGMFQSKNTDSSGI